MAKFPGKGDLRAASYFRVYQALTADVDLTSEVEQARNASSGMVVTNESADTPADIIFDDCSGTEVTWPVAPNTTIKLPIGAIRLDEATGDTLAVLVYWHPSTAR